jgi:hypothetical protein
LDCFPSYDLGISSFLVLLIMYHTFSDIMRATLSE